MVNGWRYTVPKAAELRKQPIESEKITLNLGPVDLGQVDLLVQDGFYANRTDFIRSAIRSQLARHEQALAGSVARHQLELGIRRFSRADLLAARERGEPLHIHVLGLAVIADDVEPALARAAIASIQVLGALRAPGAVKAALADRMR
jgi:Arc/MetJ-type ribon-helix-helix transcriptional regulator